MLDKLGLHASEFFAVEDSPRGLAAARAAGLRCIVLHSELLDGYEFDGAYRVVDSHRQVESELDALLWTDCTNNSPHLMFMAESSNPPGVSPTPVFVKLVELLAAEGARYRVIEHPAAGKSEEVARIRGRKSARVPRQWHASSRFRIRHPGIIFAIGDCAYAVDGEGKAIPPCTQAAHQQAKYLASWFNYELGDNALPKKEFICQDRGSLISVGRDAGVGNLMGNLFCRTRFVQSWYARLMYASLHMLHNKEVLGIWKTLAAAASRLLLRRVRPLVKLH